MPPRGPAACPCRCGRGVGDPELLKAPRGVFARPRRMPTGKKNAKLDALQRWFVRGVCCLWQPLPLDGNRVHEQTYERTCDAHYVEGCR